MTISTIGQQLDPLWQVAQNAANTLSSTTQSATSSNSQTSPAIIVDISGGATISGSTSVSTMTKAEQEAAKKALEAQEKAAEAAAKAAKEAAEDTAKAQAKTAKEAAEAQEKAAKEAAEAAKKAAEDSAKAQAKAEKEALEAAKNAPKNKGEATAVPAGAGAAQLADGSEGKASSSQTAFDAGMAHGNTVDNAPENQGDVNAWPTGATVEHGVDTKNNGTNDRAAADGKEASENAAENPRRNDAGKTAEQGEAAVAQGAGGRDDKIARNETAAAASRASEKSRASERAGPKEKGWEKLDKKVGKDVTAPTRPNDAAKTNEVEEVIEVAVSRAEAARVQAALLRESVISLIGSTDDVGLTLKPIETASTEWANGFYTSLASKREATEVKPRTSVAA